MATISSSPISQNDYPTSDGKPMAETDWHRDLMNALIDTLKLHYRSKQRVYVSGNLLLFYEPGNKRRHLSPDVFVVKGVAKQDRPNYLLWQEGKAPNIVVEITSSTTRREDQGKKLQLYRDVLKVKEYFLFDPLGDYLQPPLQGYRLRAGAYYPIAVVAGRLPSRQLQLHLEGVGKVLRLYDPASGQWLLSPRELADQAEETREQAEAERQHAEAARQQAEEQARREAVARQQAENERQEAKAENERLRQELEMLRRQLEQP